MFIKLTKRIINLQHIREIIIEPNLYKIIKTNHSFMGWFILSGGFIQTHDNTIEICKNENPEDYKIIETYIDFNIKNVCEKK
jgi:hypothetical protein